jgi:RecJ-like exonuclease
MGKTYDVGNYTLKWTIPVSGKLGDLVKLYENNTLISQKSIDPTSALK